MLDVLHVVLPGFDAFDNEVPIRFGEFLTLIQSQEIFIQAECLSGGNANFLLFLSGLDLLRRSSQSFLSLLGDFGDTLQEILIFFTVLLLCRRLCDDFLFYWFRRLRPLVLLGFLVLFAAKIFLLILG